MRLSRLRLSMRSMMIAVAVAGMLLAAGIEGDRRRERFKKSAWEHGVKNTRLLSHAYYFSFVPAVHPSAIIYKERLAYHSALCKKYEWASRYPWFPTSSEPPEPPEFVADKADISNSSLAHQAGLPGARTQVERPIDTDDSGK